MTPDRQVRVCVCTLSELVPLEARVGFGDYRLATRLGIEVSGHAASGKQDRVMAVRRVSNLFRRVVETDQLASGATALYEHFVRDTVLETGADPLQWMYGRAAGFVDEFLEAALPRPGAPTDS